MLGRAARTARSTCHGLACPPAPSVTRKLEPKAATEADSCITSSCGTGSAVLDVSDFSSSAGHCTVGLTTPREKSTSSKRSPHASAVRSPTKAPSRTATRRCSGNLSCRAHTCSVVAT